MPLPRGPRGPRPYDLRRNGGAPCVALPRFRPRCGSPRPRPLCVWPCGPTKRPRLWESARRRCEIWAATAPHSSRSVGRDSIQSPACKRGSMPALRSRLTCLAPLLISGGFYLTNAKPARRNLGGCAPAGRIGPSAMIVSLLRRMLYPRPRVPVAHIGPRRPSPILTDADRRRLIDATVAARRQLGVSR